MKKLIIAIVIMMLTSACDMEYELSIVETGIENSLRPLTSRVTEIVHPDKISNRSIPNQIPESWVIDIDPKDVICQISDMPEGGKDYGIHIPLIFEIGQSNYGLFNYGIFQEERREYVESSGRVSGWADMIFQNSPYYRYPEFVLCQAALFQTTESVKIDLAERGDFEVEESNWVLSDRPFELGDQSVSVKKSYLDNNQLMSEYKVMFTYRNMLVEVDGFWEDNLYYRPELIEDIAKKLLVRIQEVPLVDPDDAWFSN